MAILTQVVVRSTQMWLLMYMRFSLLNRDPFALIFLRGGEMPSQKKFSCFARGYNQICFNFDARTINTLNYLRSTLKAGPTAFCLLMNEMAMK